MENALGDAAQGFAGVFQRGGTQSRHADRGLHRFGLPPVYDGDRVEALPHREHRCHHLGTSLLGQALGLCDAFGEASDEPLRVLDPQVADCTRCAELAATRTRTVFGAGPPDARLCFLGEAPGADEDASGEPFVGSAGQLLTKIIEACTLSRDDVYILNVLKCRPPGNRTPTAAEQAVCAPFVERAFALLRPKAVLLLGAAAARSVLATDEGIMRMLGHWREWRLAEGAISAPALPTLHPAFLLRQPIAKRDVWADLLSLAARIEP
jgi:DNA polymerase